MPAAASSPMAAGSFCIHQSHLPCKASQHAAHSPAGIRFGQGLLTLPAVGTACFRDVPAKAFDIMEAAISLRWVGLGDGLSGAEWM